MLGFADPWVAAAYLLCIASTLLCIVYGVLNWNVDDNPPPIQHPEGEDLEFEQEL